MLIINADDLGQTRQATDRIVSCYRHGSVTSASAMVFMSDSERAAELARETGMDTGLHLNFTQPFTQQSHSPLAAEYQGQIIRFLTRNKFSQLFYNPVLRKQFRYVFQTQLEEFRRLFGSSPSHFDGHHHMHLCANMLVGGVIPAGQKVRRSFSFFPGEKCWPNRACRWLIARFLRSKYCSTDYLFALTDCIRSNRLRDIVELAKGVHVELETHPGDPDEFAWHMSSACSQVLASAKTGTYASL